MSANETERIPMNTAGTKVAIVGSGLIGRAWAISFARAGCQVRLWDPNEEATKQALAFVEASLGDLVANDLLGGRSPADVLAHITPTSSLQDALADAEWVQENGPETLADKHAIFGELDALASPGAILASSTSGLLPSAISENLKGRERFIIAHPINPPHLVPAVELVPSPWTSAEVMERASAFLSAVGQKPLVMKQEIEGFVVNRLQGALLDEAFRLVAGGYADPEDVDKSICEGLALRWSFIGPFETIDLNSPGGVADYVARYKSLYSGLTAGRTEAIDWSGQVLSTVLAARRRALPGNRLPERQLWRDRRLMALRAHKCRAERELGR